MSRDHVIIILSSNHLCAEGCVCEKYNTYYIYSTHTYEYVLPERVVLAHMALRAKMI